MLVKLRITGKVSYSTTRPKLEKTLTALENSNIILTVKFERISVMVWGCNSAKGIGDLVFIQNKMNAQ